MRDNRLKLVPPENNASAVTDGTKELPNEPANPDSGRQLLRLVNSDEEHRRTTRRDRCRSSTCRPGPTGVGTGFVIQSIRVRVPGPAPRSCSSVGRARA